MWSTRYLAAQKLKLKTMPCIVADDLSEKEIKAFRIADNKIHERSTWDNDLLKEELDQLENMGINLEELGFLDFELNALFDKEIDIDEFFQDKEVIGEEKKIQKVNCPECGHEFEI